MFFGTWIFLTLYHTKPICPLHGFHVDLVCWQKYLIIIHYNCWNWPFHCQIPSIQTSRCIGNYIVLLFLIELFVFKNMTNLFCRCTLYTDSGNVVGSGNCNKCYCIFPMTTESASQNADICLIWIALCMYLILAIAKKWYKLINLCTHSLKYVALLLLRMHP